MNNMKATIMTTSILTFVYLMIATPFITWAVFRYTDMKANKIYAKALEDDLTIVKEKMEAITGKMEKLLTEINSIKLKAGFSGEKKKFLN